MTAYKDALSKVLKNVKTKTKYIHYQNLKGDILAEDIKSKKDNPYYNNSLLDGFAFKSHDTKKNLFFKINGALAVGENKAIQYEKNTCYRISTGGKIIPPYDCMLPYENINVFDGLVQIPREIKKLTNVRVKGTDFKKNQVLIKKNQKISPAKKLLIKSSGNLNVKVYEKPNIFLFCSGDEITDKVELNEKVVNSIPEYFELHQEKLNYSFNYLGIVKDDKKSIDKIFSKISRIKNSIIISTGGVSAGHKDFFPQYLKQKKYKILFHKIKMQPGRPTLFARKGSNYYFGLPGNPISSIVGFHFLISPLLMKMQNQIIKTKTANMLHSYSKNPNLTQLRRAFVNEKGIKIIPDQESYKINSLVKANAWIILDQKTKLIKRGEKVKYIEYEN